MSVENRCPICGALLPKPGGKCPFCTEAQQLVEHLASAEQVRLCARCGAILEEGDEGDLCARCRLQAMVRPPAWRREDRIARWLRDHVVEPPLPQESLQTCPRCGKAIPAHSLFCLYCGAPVAAKEPAVAEEPSGESRASTPEAAPPGGERVPSEEPAAGPPGEAVAGESPSPTPASPPPQPLLHRLRDFWREQFRPAPAGTPRSPLSFPGGVGKIQTWVWVLLGLVLLGLAGMAVFWTMLLNSGGIVLR